ncbi:acid phosphatase protein [Diplodia corticola]|uniref:Acid phosphatase protein n=1 Tax=Diplodia corticola TaxID=236234 RepID=A0A1J9RJB9_9PEZI|nr:acid phosphatase protein [Diplodia corticola]OJD28631.1 acid phosphatase protein [Diplodia corticola]
MGSLNSTNQVPVSGWELSDISDYQCHSRVRDPTDGVESAHGGEPETTPFPKYGIGTSSSANRTLGFAVTTEQYIHVRWAWITLPVAVVVMGIMLLVLAIVHTKRSGVTSWKSSSILALFAQLDGWDEDDLRPAAGPVKGLERQAKGMSAVIKVDGGAGKVLFVNTPRGVAGMHDI